MVSKRVGEEWRDLYMARDEVICCCNALSCSPTEPSPARALHNSSPADVSQCNAGGSAG